MDSENFETKIKGWFSKSAKASKQAFEKAGDKVQDFTDKSVLKIEKKQLETKIDAKYMELGLKVSNILASGVKVTVEDETEQKAVDSIQKEINKLTKQIKEKESEINA